MREVSLFGCSFMRIEVLDEGGGVELIVYPEEGGVVRVRINVQELPAAVQNKLATLSMRSYVPPTEDIPDVGRRVSEYVYWVYLTGDDLDGYDPRKKSKEKSNRTAEKSRR